MKTKVYAVETFDYGTGAWITRSIHRTLEGANEAAQVQVANDFMAVVEFYDLED